MYLFFRLTYFILFWLLCSFWLWLNGNVKTSFTIKNNCPKFRTSNFFMNENWISTGKRFLFKKTYSKSWEGFLLTFLDRCCEPVCEPHGKLNSTWIWPQSSVKVFQFHNGEKQGKEHRYLTSELRPTIKINHKRWRYFSAVL